MKIATVETRKYSKKSIKENKVLKFQKKSLPNGVDSKTFNSKIKENSELPKWIGKNENGKTIINDLMLGQEILKKEKMLVSKESKYGYYYNKEKGYWLQSDLKEYINNKIANIFEKYSYWNAAKSYSIKSFVLAKIYKPTSISPFDVSCRDKPYLVHFLNGTYDFNTDRLQKNNPDDYILQGHNYKLSMNKKAPITNKWLTESFGQDAAFIKEYIGYCFYRSYQPFQKFVIIHGNGDNGKSTFFNFLKKMMGDNNTASVSPEELADSQKGRFSRALLYQKDLDFLADIGKGYIKETSLIKDITGNDTVKAEFKGKDGFSFVNHAKLFFGANDLPTFKDSSNGFSRRATIVKINKIEDFSKRYDKTKLDAEIPAFAYECILSFKKAMSKSHFTISEKINQGTDEWLTENDTIQTFLDEQCKIDITFFVLKTTAYRLYKNFCTDNNIYPVSNQRFKKELEKKGFKSKKKWISNENKSDWFYIGFDVV